MKNKWKPLLFSGLCFVNSMALNAPLRTVNVSHIPDALASLLEISQKGYEIMACHIDGNDIYIRIANTGIGNEAAG